MKRTLLYFLVFTFVLYCFAPVYATQLSEYKQQSSNVRSKLNRVYKDKQEVERAIESEKDHLENLLEKQRQREKEYQTLRQQKRYLDDVVKEMNQELEKAENRYNEQRQLLGKRIKVMYENSNVSYLQTLIESKSIVDFFQRLHLISLVAQNDKALIKSLSEAKKDVEYKRQLKAQEQKRTEEAASGKKDDIIRLSRSRADADDQIKEYEMTLEELEKQEDDLIRESADLNRKIKNLMSKAKYSGGRMRWPCPSSGVITSYYGMRFHPILKKYKLHTGIDIGGGMGASITAAANGRVIIAEWQNGYGKTVVIDHGGGIATRYAHASSILVGVGQSVDTGQTIAKVGSTGWSTGPHLHFEVIKDGNTQNPLSYLRH